MSFSLYVMGFWSFSLVPLRALAGEKTGNDPQTRHSHHSGSLVETSRSMTSSGFGRVNETYYAPPCSRSHGGHMPPQISADRSAEDHSAAPRAASICGRGFLGRKAFYL